MRSVAHGDGIFATNLTGFPVGLALFDEGARAFFVVFGLFGDLEVACGDLFGLGNRKAEAWKDAHLGAPHRERRIGSYHFS